MICPEAAFDPGTPRLSVLYEQWASCAGIWKESALYIRMKSTQRNKTRGCRQWLTFEQICSKYGSFEVATSITEYKLNLDEESRKGQVRNHPDCPEQWLQISELGWAEQSVFVPIGCSSAVLCSASNPYK